MASIDHILPGGGGVGLLKFSSSIEEKKLFLKERYIGQYIIYVYCNCEVKVKGKLVARGDYKANGEHMKYNVVYEIYELPKAKRNLPKSKRNFLYSR